MAKPEAAVGGLGEAVQQFNVALVKKGRLIAGVRGDLKKMLDRIENSSNRSALSGVVSELNTLSEKAATLAEFLGFITGRNGDWHMGSMVQSVKVRK